MRSAFLAFSVLLLTAAPLRALQTTAPTATGPSTTPAGAIVMRAAITSVKGVVQVRQTEDQPWQTAAVGMQLGQGAELRTGLRSAVQFVIEPDQVITLDRLGTLKVLQAYLDHNKVTTDLGVKYGRTRYDIRSADLEHQSTIRSPGSTLAIRGTDVTYEDQAPWVPSAVSRHGRAQFRNFRKEFLPFGGTRNATVAADKNSAAQQARSKTTASPRGAFPGQTAAENDLLLALPQGGGIDAQGLQALQDLAKIGGFTGPFIAVPLRPGPLAFFMDFFSNLPKPGPTRVDFQVTDPLGNTASITNRIIGKGSAQGVYIDDFKASANFGEAQVFYRAFFPAGTYKVAAISRSGDPALVLITVTLGIGLGGIGVPPTLKTFGFSPGPAIVLAPGQSFTGTVVVQPPPAAPTAPAARNAGVSRRVRGAGDALRGNERAISIRKR